MLAKYSKVVQRFLSPINFIVMVLCVVGFSVTMAIILALNHEKLEYR